MVAVAELLYVLVSLEGSYRSYSYPVARFYVYMYFYNCIYIYICMPEPQRGATVGGTSFTHDVSERF